MKNINLIPTINSILIFGAMDVETEYIISKLENVTKTEFGAYPFYEGRFKNKKIIVCRTFTGMENSAAATAIGIMKFLPDCIISQGTAGGHNPNLHKNDIVIGERLVNIASIKTQRHAKGQGIHPTEWQLTAWDNSNTDDNNPYLYSDKNLVHLAMNTKYKKGSLIKGTISSSNNWNRELDRINHFVETFNSSCEEMESYAVTKIANRFNIPSLTIRIISNSEQHVGEEYERTIGQICQEYVLDVIENLRAKK